MNLNQTLSMADYIVALQTPNEGSSPEAAARIKEELARALEMQKQGVAKVRLAFRRNGANRQWIR